MVTNGNWRAATAAVVLMAATAGVHGQTVLTASSWVPPGHSMAAAQKQWCDLLEQRSSARLKCNILPRGVASPPGNGVRTSHSTRCSLASRPRKVGPRPASAIIAAIRMSALLSSGLRATCP